MTKLNHLIEFDIPQDKSSIIKVFGVGGGGSNAVNHMFELGIEGVNYVICNTDNQALEMSEVPNKVQLGSSLRQGLGAGSKPEIGREATEEAIDQLEEILQTGTKMIFITAGMGGGTGTGGAPVVAKLARDMGILTVAIVTTPFSFEGKKRLAQAQAGIDELKSEVDALLVISNDKLREVYGNLRMSEAFGKADDILTVAAKGIAEIITKTGYINVDFEDVNTVMRDSGVALMGVGIASGDNRSFVAIEEALQSPLLNDNNISGARRVLLNMSYGEEEITMDEMDEITDYVQNAIGVESDNFIFGLTQDESLGDNVRVTLIATGFESKEELQKKEKEGHRVVHTLDNTTTIGRNVSGSKSPSEPFLKQDEKENSRQIQLEFRSDKTKQNSNQAILSNIDKVEKITIKEQSVNEQVIDIQEEFSQELEDNYDLQDEDQKIIENTLDERLERLKSFSVKYRGNSVEEMEQIPAYIRKNIHLEKGPDSSSNEVSTYSLGKENEPNPIGKNSFLHDNVD